MMVKEIIVKIARKVICKKVPLDKLSYTQFFCFDLEKDEVFQIWINDDNDNDSRFPIGKMGYRNWVTGEWFEFAGDTSHTMVYKLDQFYFGDFCGFSLKWEPAFDGEFIEKSPQPKPYTVKDVEIKE